MTAIVALEHCDPSAMVRIPSSAVGIEGSSIYLYDGEMLSMEHLLYALLLESANDAAVAIAIAVCGTVEDFVDLMNQKAMSLGLTNTHFTNPHGLDHEEHYTSASDLAKLAAYCLQNDLFRNIVSTQRMTIPLNDQEGVRLLLNHNRLLRSYEGTIGLKTGFTKRSGRCLVSAAQRNGITMICVTLNAPDDWDDHRNMLDYAFSQYTSIILQYAESYVREIPLIGALQSKVAVCNLQDVQVILPQTHGEIQVFCQAPRYFWVDGYIPKGHILGYLIWQCDGQIIAQEPLVAQAEIIPLASPHSWWKRLLSLFNGHQKTME
jgi:D-alanyl-D-alanine carboxypeptidase